MQKNHTHPTHKRLLGPNGNLWMKKTNQEAISLKRYVVVGACSGEQVKRDLCCNPKKWQETLFQKEIQTGSCFFGLNERLWSCPTSLPPQRYLVDEIGTGDVTLRRSTSNSSKNLCGYSMLWCSEFCWFAEFWQKSDTVVIPKIQSGFSQGWQLSWIEGVFISGWQLKAVSSDKQASGTIDDHLHCGSRFCCILHARANKIVPIYFVSFHHRKKSATWRLIPASITEGGHWNLLGAFSNVMRIPVGNHFLSIEKPNNVWFTAKVTYDKMDARKLFGFLPTQLPATPVAYLVGNPWLCTAMVKRGFGLSCCRRFISWRDVIACFSKLHDPLNS